MIFTIWSSDLANHVWQSTLLAGVAALLALALRKNHARTRHALWLAASVKFLVPFSLLVAVGSRLEWPAPRAVAQPGLTVVMEQISQPFAAAQPVAANTPPGLAQRLSPRPFLAIWVCGFMAVAFSWWRGWRRVHAAVRAASPLALEADVPVLSSRELLEPGVFGVFRPVLLLPDGIQNRLTAAHLRAIVAHEMCHVRRRDNLAAAIHMVVEAVFWFHPLVWWLGARLVEERERACDEEVLRLGSEPEVYAESILKTCQFYLESPLACMSGISGSDLKKRIVHIMSRHAAAQLSVSRKVLLSVAGMTAVAGPILVGLVNAPQSRAQSQATAAGQRPAFEVASIKLNKSGDHRVMLMDHPGGRFNASNVTAKLLIEFAYNLKDSQVVGAAGWMDSESYDVEAKAEAPAPGSRKLSDEEEMDRRRLMLQSLLADRFKLTLRKETKELPVYLLTVSKTGPKLHQSADAADEGPPPPPPPPGEAPVADHAQRSMAKIGRGELTMNDAPLSLLADSLSRQLGRTVIDSTGLKGKYDLALKWTPDESQGPMFKGAGEGADGKQSRDAAPPPDAAGISVFTALQEQLGLKLESKKGPVDTFVIEHVERPSEN